MYLDIYIQTFVVGIPICCLVTLIQGLLHIELGQLM